MQSLGSAKRQDGPVDLEELVAARGGLRAQGYTPNKRFLLNTVAGATQANRAQQVQQAWRVHDERLEERGGRDADGRLDADFEARRLANAARLRAREEELRAEREREAADDAAAEAAAAAARPSDDELLVAELRARAVKRGRGETGAAMDGAQPPPVGGSDAPDAGRGGHAGATERSADPPAAVGTAQPASHDGHRRKRKHRSRSRSRKDGSKKRSHKHKTHKRRESSGSDSSSSRSDSDRRRRRRSRS